MSRGDLVDDLARALAEPIPRRHAVRLLAGAIAAAAVPAARPRRAGAAGNPNCPGTSCPHPNGGCAPNLKPCPYGCCSKNDSCCVGAKDSIGNLQVACCPPGTTCCGKGTPYPRCCAKGLKCETVDGTPQCVAGELCTFDDPLVTSIKRESRYDPKTQCCTPRGVQPKTGDFNLSACEQTLTPRKGYKPTADGCGSMGVKVPGKWGKVDFTPACNAHDRCYGTCGADKGECDRAFRERMRETCGRGYREGSSGYSACVDRASTFYDAVSGSGYIGLAREAFVAAQRQACQCCK